MLKKTAYFSTVLKGFYFLLLLLIADYTASAQYLIDTYYEYGPLKYEDHIYQPGIKTVQLHPMGNDQAMPIIPLNSSAQLLLSFDDLYEGFGNYSYTIVHCDAKWQPSDLMKNDYLANFRNDYIQDYEYSVNALVPYTHFELRIPNQQVRFTKSGNYLLIVYANDDPEQLVLTRRFMVYEEIVRIGATVQRANKVDKMNTHQEIDFSIFTNDYPVPNPFTDLKVTLMQNQRWDNPITDLKPQFVQNGQFIYQYDDENTFAGLNEFRFFDIKNLQTLSLNVRRIKRDTGLFTVYLKQDQPRSIERYSVQFDVNGQYRVRRLDASSSSSEADYALVDFILNYPQPLANGDVYVFGELSDWKLRPELRMQYDYDRQAYRLQTYLKQGYYNYVYATLPDGATEADIETFEGSHWQTENNYQIIVYHREIGSRYDRLVGFSSFSSDDLFKR
jgi:hypothetical protein